ncbi:MAG: calcium-binding protein [Pseudomonadota bacterium]
MAIRIWNTPTIVNATTGGSQLNPDITLLSNGQTVIVWEDLSTDPDRVVMRIYNSDGTAASGEMVVDVDGQRPHVIALANGHFIVTYETNASGADRAKIFTNAGVQTSSIGFAAGEIVNQPESVLVDGTGFWQLNENSGADNTIVAFRSTVDNSGIDTSLGSLTIQQSITGSQTNPSGAQLRNNDVVLVWQTGADAVFRIFDNTGVPQTSDIEASAIGADASLGFGNPEVLALENGGFLFTWADSGSFFPGSDFDVWGRIYSSSAVALTPAPFLINSVVASNQFNQVAVPLKGGGFMVIFQGNVAGIQDVRAQMFDVLGNRIGIEFVLTNDTGSISTDTIDAALLEDGRIQVTWEAIDGDGSPGAIVTQIIDPRDGNVFGDNSDNTLLGGRGDDDIFGRGGNDILDGFFTGDDAFFGGAGNDQMTSGRGNDTFDGGEGVDLVNFGGARNGVVANLSTGTADGDGADRLIGVENIIGSNFVDTLIGDNAANTVFGLGGNDSLATGAGNDALFGGLGDDVMDGGSDTDSAQYSFAGGAVTVNLGIGTASGEGTDTLIRIENVLGSGFGDVLVGSSGNNEIFGQGGDDLIFGQAGVDALFGGSGNDVFIYSAGDGFDTIFDFTPGVGIGDRLRVDQITNFTNILAATNDDGMGNTIITVDGSNAVTLFGVLEAQLVEDDFLFL